MWAMIWSELISPQSIARDPESATLMTKLVLMTAVELDCTESA